MVNCKNITIDLLKLRIAEAPLCQGTLVSLWHLTALAASDTMVSVIRCTPPFLGTAVTIRARATWRFLEIENTPGPLAARRSQCIPARSIAISSTHYVILYINTQKQTS